MKTIPKAFSLLEILIIIALISVLAAVVFPLTRAGTVRARQAQCATNLRQLYNGMVAYATEHRNELPAKASTDLWHRKIWPYLQPGATEAEWPKTGEGAAKAYRCPADEDSEYAGISYALNQNLFGTRLNASSEVILLMDFNTYGVSGSKVNLDARMKGRHGGRDHLIFQDGHVIPRKRIELEDRSVNPRLWGR